MQTITVNINLSRGSLRISNPLYLGETVKLNFSDGQTYKLILTEPTADSPKDVPVGWAQSDEEGKLSLTRKALHTAFVKAEAMQPNMTVSAKAYAIDETGETVADGEITIEYSPKAFVIDDEDYPLAKEVLLQATSAKDQAIAAKDSAITAKDKAESAQSAAENAKAKAILESKAATTEREIAQQAATLAVQHATIATSASSSALKAQTASEDAQHSAETAASAAQVAKDEAQGIANETAQQQVEKVRQELLPLISEKANSAEFDKVVEKIATLIGNDDGYSVRQITAGLVAEVVSGADKNFDTLKEIADWILNDTTGAAALANAAEDLKNKTLNLENTKADATALEAEAARAQGAEAALGETLAKKVDAEEGKGLSANDYTNEEKDKLGGIEAGAQKNPDLRGYAKKTEVISAIEEQNFSDGEKSLASVNGGYRYRIANLAPTTEVVNGVDYLRYNLEDYAINVVTLDVTTPVRIYLPSRVDNNGRCRDCVLKLKVIAETLPTVEFVKSADDDSIGFESDNEEWMLIEHGVNYFTFTETEMA